MTQLSPTNPISEVLEFVTSIISRFGRDQCPTNASALAFTTLLALVPLAAVVFSTLSVFPVFEDWLEKLEIFIYQNFVPTAGDAVKVHLQEFTTKTRELTSLGVVMLVVTALLLLSTIEETFNKIWRVKKGRRLIQRVMAYWAVLTLGPVLIGASLSVSTDFLGTILATEMAGSTTVTWLPFLFEVVAFTILYTMMPNCSVRLIHGLAGGVVATIFFEMSKLGFTFFMANMGSYEVIYGALATIPAFLIWLYLSWLVILLGAEFTAVLGEELDTNTVSTD